MSERKGKLLVNAGKGEKYREVPLNKDTRHAFFELGYKAYSGKDEFIFIVQRGALSHLGVFNLC